MYKFMCKCTVCIFELMYMYIWCMCVYMMYVYICTVYIFEVRIYTVCRPYKLKPVSDVIMSTLPAVSYRDAARSLSHFHSHSQQQSACLICSEECGNSDVVTVLPTCNHMFHYECIAKWLKLVCIYNCVLIAIINCIYHRIYCIYVYSKIGVRCVGPWWLQALTLMPPPLRWLQE